MESYAQVSILIRSLFDAAPGATMLLHKMSTMSSGALAQWSPHLLTVGERGPLNGLSLSILIDNDT